MPDRNTSDPKPSGGLNERTLAGEEQEPLGGTGGSAGGGTRAGRGDPSGGPADPRSEERTEEIDDAPHEEIARHAGALGSADGSMADAASGGRNDAVVRTGPVGAESVGAGAGRGDVGSGPPRDRGELGGGGPAGRHGGPGPAGSDGGD